VIINGVKTGKGNYGYNARTEKFCDLVESGIIDPTKVTRLALENAASIAGLLLTTECVIAKTKDKEAQPQGMGGMMM
jgi:chaperonin GroEL